MLKLIKKASLEGVVLAVRKNGVVVARTNYDSDIDPSKICGPGGSGNCTDCKECAKRIRFTKGGYIGKIYIRADDPEKFSAGDVVNYDYFFPGRNLERVLVFGIPLACVFIAVLCVGLCVGTGLPTYGIYIISALAAFFGWLAAQAIFKKKYPAAITDKKRYRAEVVVVGPDGKVLL
jgi:hypothetical protein